MSPFRYNIGDVLRSNRAVGNSVYQVMAVKKVNGELFVTLHHYRDIERFKKGDCTLLKEYVKPITIVNNWIKVRTESKRKGLPYLDQLPT